MLKVVLAVVGVAALAFVVLAIWIVQTYPDDGAARQVPTTTS
jgi:hypothetical protein